MSLLDRANREEMNFIERKRQWRSGMEKPLGRRMFMMIAPIIMLSVFALLAVPYLPKLTAAIQRSMGNGDPVLNLANVGADAPAEPAEPAGPPPSPEQAEAEFYQKAFEAEGFDWTRNPELESSLSEPGLVPDRAVEINPVPVELPIFGSALDPRFAPDEESAE